MAVALGANAIDLTITAISEGMSREQPSETQEWRGFLREISLAVVTHGRGSRAPGQHEHVLPCLIRLLLHVNLALSGSPQRLQLVHSHVIDEMGPAISDSGCPTLAGRIWEQFSPDRLFRRGAATKLLKLSD